MPTLTKSKGQYILHDVELKTADEMFVDSGESLEVELKIIDARLISERQRKFIFALCKDVAYYTGDDPEYIRLLMQQFYSNLKGIEVESLSKCSVSYANGLIETIITFAIDRELPIAKKLLDDNEYRFNYSQTYSMTLKRVCAVCGRKADIHHIDTVGMGNNRNKINHIGKRVIPLCREHHNEAHMNPNFIELNHLLPITVDEKMDYFIKKGKLKIHKEKE